MRLPAKQEWLGKAYSFDWVLCLPSSLDLDLDLELADRGSESYEGCCETDVSAGTWSRLTLKKYHQPTP